MSGIIPNSTVGNLCVHADADIMAKTVRTLTQTEPLTVTKRIKTGNVTKKYCIQIFGKDFDMFLRAPEYTHYDGVIHEKNIRFFGEYFLPVLIRTYEYNEVKPTGHKRDAGEIENELKAKLLRDMKMSVGEENVISTDFETFITDESVTVTLIANCRENIAKAEEIIFDGKPFLITDISPETITNET